MLQNNVVIPCLVRQQGVKQNREQKQRIDSERAPDSECGGIFRTGERNRGAKTNPLITKKKSTPVYRKFSQLRSTS